jgi:hypothetical protein
LPVEANEPEPLEEIDLNAADEIDVDSLEPIEA